MFELKPVSKEAIPRALEKAEHYRGLNEPAEAQSICLDVLAVDPDNREAIVTLLLALTDQFDGDFAETAARQAKELLPRIRDDYERAYYGGIVCERRAKGRLARGGLDANFAAYEWFRDAMEEYERAERLRPPGNDDALLRWNTCARILMRNGELRPRPDDGARELPLE